MPDSDTTFDPSRELLELLRSFLDKLEAKVERIEAAQSEQTASLAADLGRVRELLDALSTRIDAAERSILGMERELGISNRRGRSSDVAKYGAGAGVGGGVVALIDMLAKFFG